MEQSFNLSKREFKELRRLIFNPFYYIAGGKALAIGIAVITVTGSIGSLVNLRFDGVLDFHLGGLVRPPLWLSFSEGFISWLLMGALLLATGKAISSSRIRALDVLGTQALARFPYFFTALAALLPGSQRFARSLVDGTAVWNSFSMDLVMFSFTILVSILMAVWMVALMYRAYTVSCNVSGGKAIAFFITALILGETISKVILVYIS